MRSLVPKLVLAALVAATLPAGAFAHDGDRDDGPPAAWPAPPPDRGPWPGAWRDGRDGWRHGDGDRWRDGWRVRERAELRAEFAALEQQRADFYARFGWNPWRVRRFERWYAFRRAELERRWLELQRFAWR